MAKIHEVQVDLIIEKVAERLKAEGTVKMPEWAQFVKTGPSRERTPSNENWWHIRAASILKTVYERGPIGVNKLRLKYGGKRNRGHKPERFYKSSGKIIRVLLQQLETAGLLEQKVVGVHKGRVLTNGGKSFVDKIASEIVGKKPKKAAKKVLQAKVKQAEPEQAKVKQAEPEQAKVKQAEPEQAKDKQAEIGEKAEKPKPKEEKDVKNKDKKQKDKAVKKE